MKKNSNIIFERISNQSLTKGIFFSLILLTLIFYILYTQKYSLLVCILVTGLLLILVVLSIVFSYRKIIIHDNGMIEIVRLVNKKRLFYVNKKSCFLVRYLPPSQTWSPPIIQLREMQNGDKLFSFPLVSDAEERLIIKLFEQKLEMKFKDMDYVFRISRYK